ncbi:Nucleotide-binding alpha-beta plait [Penicillium sp. DV-2018c]|nr:Nucleotide-binding alpha-beta plait [Penicillium sp. DV-2018c]KAJ5571338.1 Nucleotide-binding alpha-beta plait [Penicillium sp. DV-2018c]
MPFLGREKPRLRSRRSEDEFVVFLQGIPPHCRWQELKDLVRQTALHIRQAVVYDDSHGFPTGLGQIIIKNEDEAWRTYHRLSTNGWDGQSLVVTLSRTSTPTQPIAGPTRSPPARIRSGYLSGQSTPPAGHGNMAIPPSPVSPESAHPATPPFPFPDYGPIMAPMPMPPRSFIPMLPDPFAPSIQCFPPSPVMNVPSYEPHWNMMPGYQMTPSHSMHSANGDQPVSTRQYSYQCDRSKGSDPHPPSFYPERRALTLENLNPNTTCADLKGLLQTAGTVEHCNIITSDSTNNGQTRGLVTMQSAEDAHRALIMLNNLTFLGARIRVKLDLTSYAMQGADFDAMSPASLVHEAVGPAVEPVKGGVYQSWAKEVTAQIKAVDTSKPLVIDGSGLNKSVENLSIAAPT